MCETQQKHRGRANAQERGRVRAMRRAYHHLSTKIPIEDSEVKLSQLDIIYRARDFIIYLQQQLEEKRKLAEVEEEMSKMLEARHPQESLVPSSSAIDVPLSSLASTSFIPTPVISESLVFGHSLASCERESVCDRLSFTTQSPAPSVNSSPTNTLTHFSPAERSSSVSPTLGVAPHPLEQPQRMQLSQYQRPFPNSLPIHCNTTPMLSLPTSPEEQGFVPMVAASSVQPPPTAAASSVNFMGKLSHASALSPVLSDYLSDSSTSPSLGGKDIAGGLGFYKSENRRHVDTHRVNINKRLRNMSRNIREGIDNLRDHVPVGSAERHLCTAEVLRRATLYIKVMRDMTEQSIQ